MHLKFADECVIAALFISSWTPGSKASLTPWAVHTMPLLMGTEKQGERSGAVFQCICVTAELRVKQEECRSG